MNSLRATFIANRNYFTCFLLFFLAGLIFLVTEGKAASFVDLNPYHQNFLDNVFITLTFLGDGLFTILVFVILMAMRRYSRGCQVITSFLLSALLAQILKSAFSMPRPREFFSKAQYGHFINGVTHSGFASFPSGHSTSVFALATILALCDPDKKRNVLYLFVAVAVGYSRIYLGQHFLGDVLVGSLVGIMVSVFVHWLFTEKVHFSQKFH